MSRGDEISLRQLCRKETDLTDDDIAQLELVATSLQHMSDLEHTDIFIDCMCPDGVTGLVVAEAHPAKELSMYDRRVTGELALPENEPAVYRAFSTGAPVRDMFAVTQENRSVLQAVAPIRNPAGRIIGVLIQERDVSDSVKREKRYRGLAKLMDEHRGTLGRMGNGDLAAALVMDEARLVVKEVHHRVKNNLQLIASMLGLQARSTPFLEVKAALRENVEKILGIASIYDVLAVEGTGSDESKKKIFLRPIVVKLCYTISKCLENEEEGVSIEVTDDDVLIDGDKAVFIAMAVNELVINAAKHAFPGGKPGTIIVSLVKGVAYSTVTVSDNGVGMSGNADESDSLGMNIVRALVAKVGGKLHVESDQDGSRVFFDFEN